MKKCLHATYVRHISSKPAKNVGSSTQPHLEDSVYHRSLRQELNEAREKSTLAKSLDIPSLSKPINQLLDDRFAELRSQWISFNSSLSQGKLKHLHFDENTKTLHFKKSNDERGEKLQHHFYCQLSLRDISDILRFVNERCHYSSAFTHLQPRYSKMPINKNSLKGSCGRTDKFRDFRLTSL